MEVGNQALGERTKTVGAAERSELPERWCGFAGRYRSGILSVILGMGGWAWTLGKAPRGY